MVSVSRPANWVNRSGSERARIDCAGSRSAIRPGGGRSCRTRGRDRADVIGRRAAAAADDVDESRARRTRAAGAPSRAAASSYSPKAFGSPALGWQRDVLARRGATARPRTAASDSAPNAQLIPTLNGRDVPDRDVERVERLSRQRASAAIGDRRRDHHRQLDAARLELVEHGGDRRLRVQRVEDRLEQQQVDAAVDQPADLLAVGVAHVRERVGAERRVVDVGRDRQRAVGRADRAGDEARTIGRPARTTRRPPPEPDARRRRSARRRATRD